MDDLTWVDLKNAVCGTGGQIMTTSFSRDIRGLFRDRDRDSMRDTRHGLDLWDHAQVSNWADRILAQLQRGSMPCDKAWPPENIATFKKWIADGKLP